MSMKVKNILNICLIKFFITIIQYQKKYSIINDVILFLWSDHQIQSIVSLYSNAYPNSPLCNIEYAAKYYKSRLEALVATSYQIEKGYIYIDAEDLVNNTTEILRDLTNWLHLDSPLEASYDIHKNTGKKFRGDSSRFIKTGNIQRVRSNYLDITIPTATLKSLEDLYKKCKHELIANSRCAVDVEDGK